MNYSKVIVSQSLAAFEMLRQTIIKCPSVNNSCGEVSQLNLEAASGFDWLPFSELELQFYTIRHIQQHTGECGYSLGGMKLE